MKLLFLRGQVPRDRNPRQIMFDNIDDCDDMWTQLALHLTGKGEGEVWYWGGSRRVNYSKRFREKWVPKYTKTDFTPDVVFARGGFREYDSPLYWFKNAYTIYYGAGRRFMPESRFKNYSLILCDTKRQLERLKGKYPNIRSELLVKPAADNIFHPKPGEKQYDVIFVANESKRGIKGHDFVLSSIPKQYKVVQIGIASGALKRKYPNVHFTGWIPRKEVPKWYGLSKIAVVASDKIDSCPRVIPESLACNCPLLALDSVKFWHEKYITAKTGRLCSRSDFKSTLAQMIEEYQQYSPYEHYKQELSLPVAANRIREFIGV